MREGQQAVLVNEGRVADCFGPGRHRLSTRNLPLLTSLLALPTALESPFKAEVYCVAGRRFTDLKWGTRHPLTLRDPELGPVLLRGFGSYCLQASDPVALIRSLGGSSPRFSVAAIHDQLRNLIVSRLADLLGEAQRPVLDLAAHYDELALPANPRAATAGWRYRPCPSCGELMHRQLHGRRSGAVVDRCRDHGLWLDAGELRQLLAWTRAGGQLLDQQRRLEEEREEARQQAREEADGAIAGWGPGKPNWSGDNPGEPDLLTLLLRLARLLP